MVYNAHPNLTIYAREQDTYQTAKTLYRNVKLVPDMAFLLNYSDPALQREGCVLCLRSDKEKTRTDAEEAEILRQVRLLFGEKVSFRDMNILHPVLPENRATELQKQLESFKRAKVVITDRLHGMIFCAVTATPCVVINSKSPKVKGCYEWIRDLEFIRFCDDVSQLSYIIQSLPTANLSYDNTAMLPYFAELEKDIRAAVDKSKK